MPVYKIHPAIGIMRVGDHPTAFFVGPETPDAAGTGVDSDGVDVPMGTYKDAGQIKRQAARFRVWEYAENGDGSVTPRREVTADIKVEWTVHLVNSKAAGRAIVAQQDGQRRVLVPLGDPRNPTVADRSSLVIDGGRHTIAGPKHERRRFDQGRFLGKPVYLGEMGTDAMGRLLILGGRGTSEGIPTAPGEPIPKLNSFSNNNRWYDDVSDGPVTAKITAPGQAPVEATPSWVVCAPPDFAPLASGPVTLHDIVVEAAIQRQWIDRPAQPSFRRHIFPVLARALSLRWVNDWGHWDAITSNWAALSDPSQNALRETAYGQVVQTPLMDYGLPPHLAQALQQWRDGDFINDWPDALPPQVGPGVLDRTALDAGVGANFFPGIELGFPFTDPTLYFELGRLDHGRVAAGQMSAAMALPWQADFNDCSDNWWPSQRPNYVFTAANTVPGNPVGWADGIFTDMDPESRFRMVKGFSRLGFVTPDGDGNLLETERDTTLPR